MNRQSPAVGSVSPEVGVSEPSPQPDQWYHPGSDGPQSSLRSPNRDSEGLQVSARSNGTSGGSSGIYTPDLIGMPEPKAGKIEEGYVHARPANTADQSVVARPSRRKRWWVLGAVVLVVIILAAVLGGVLGSRAHNKADVGAADAAPAASNGSSVPRRIQSRGTWNGTGLTAFPSYEPSLGYLVFQDHTSTVNWIPFHVDNKTFNVTLDRAYSIPINASNGTGFASNYWETDNNGVNGFSLQLIYVNTDGFLADEWKDNPPDGVWHAGDLASHRIPAPTDNRPGMFMAYDLLGGINSRSLGGKLYCGGTDNLIHQYSFDNASRTWFPSSTYTFPNSWAYGGIIGFDYVTKSLETNTSQSGVAAYDRTLFTTDSSGVLQSFVQKNAGDGLSTPGWPHGGQWSGSWRNQTKLLTNSSFGFGYNQTDAAEEADYNFTDIQELIIVPAANGSLTYESTILDNTDNSGHFGSSSRSPPELQMMQGSDFLSQPLPVGEENLSIVFYQQEGDSIVWLLFDDSGTQIRTVGRIALNADSEWVVTSA